MLAPARKPTTARWIALDRGLSLFAGGQELADTPQGQEQRFEVLGERPDGSVVLTSGLSKDEARRVRDALVQADVFSAVTIRPEPNRS